MFFTEKVRIGTKNYLKEESLIFCEFYFAVQTLLFNPL